VTVANSGKSQFAETLVLSVMILMIGEGGDRQPQEPFADNKAFCIYPDGVDAPTRRHRNVPCWI
jgi:hypothetical protein